MHYRSFCNFTRIKPHLNIQEMVHGYFICIFLPRADWTFRVKNVMNNYKCSQVPPLRSTSQSCTFPYVSTQKEPINCIPAGKKKKKNGFYRPQPLCGFVPWLSWWNSEADGHYFPHPNPIDMGRMMPFNVYTAPLSGL